MYYKLIKKIKKHILSVLNGGDILIIIPPMGSIKDVCLGPHILQVLAKENGYKTDILYLNILLASILGVEIYESIYFAPESWKLAERLFYRSAYGLQPPKKIPEQRINESIESVQSYPTRSYTPIRTFDPDLYQTVEQTCKTFIDEVIPVISEMGYKIVGCSSSMMRQTNCSIALLNGIKEYSAQTITIIGGDSCKGPMSEGIASLSKDVDFIFSGESEISFLNFLKDYSLGKLPSHRIIPGKSLDNQDILPLAKYEIFFKQYASFLKDKNSDKLRIWYETSRGCWWAQKSKCAFCSEHHLSYGQKSINKVLRDLEKIKTSYSNPLLYMTDIVIPDSYRRELLPILSQKTDFPSLGYQLRVTLDLKDLVDLKKAKIDVILPGIETFSTHLLKLMNKGTTGSQSLLFLRNATSIGLYANWYLLWGFPGDKLSDYQEVLQILPLIRHLQPPGKFESMVVMRFSPYFNNPQRYNITNIKPWAEFDQIYPDWTQREKLAIYFQCEFPSEAYQNQKIIEEIAQQVEIWQKTWKNTTLAMGHFMDAFAIYDNRDIHNQAKTHILDYQQAKEVMTCSIYNESLNRKWAVDEKLGVILDSCYVPLVTASPELLLEFENSTDSHSERDLDQLWPRRYSAPPATITE
jgi:ribosomal peptide maturation radical SAM protein 1